MNVISLTTIYMPDCLRDYCRNLERYGHKDVSFVVVGDLKTPPGVKEYCDNVAREFGRSITYLGVPEQQKYMERFPALRDALPFNSFARRNIGDLWAYEQGAAVIVRIDDDNFPTDDDFMTPHLACGRHVTTTTVRSSTGWYNVCEHLTEQRSVPFYPRGFPYSQRWKGEAVERQEGTGRVVINAGLWLGDPDIDAMTRLTVPINAIAMHSLGAEGVLLAPGTWCPINTQNTAFHRDTIAAAYVAPNVGRFDDIWMGYILRRIVDHMGDSVRYGWPAVSQRRNVHDLFKDLDAEMAGYRHSDRMLECLRARSFKSTSYGDCYAETLDALETSLADQRELFAPILDSGRAWCEAVATVDRSCVS